MDFVVVRASHSFRPIISLFCVFFEMIFHNSKGELAVSGNLILNIYSWRRLIVALCTSLFVCRNAWIALSRVNPISINMLMFSSEGSEKFKIIHKTSNYSSSVVILKDSPDCSRFYLLSLRLGVVERPCSAEIRWWHLLFVLAGSVFGYLVWICQ